MKIFITYAITAAILIITALICCLLEDKVAPVWQLAIILIPTNMCISWIIYNICDNESS